MRLGRIAAAVGLAAIVSSTPVAANGQNGKELGSCDSAGPGVGGVKLWNDDGQTGTQNRVVCGWSEGPSDVYTVYDNRLGQRDYSQWYQDAWNFNDQASSIRLRADPGCTAIAAFYADPWFIDHLETKSYTNYGSSPANADRELVNSTDGEASSMVFQVVCT